MAKPSDPVSHPVGSVRSAPIEPAYLKTMNELARKLDNSFNGDLHGGNRQVGFVLLVFPFGDKEGRCNYISNGADRKDIIKLLREQADRFERGF